MNEFNVQCEEIFSGCSLVLDLHATLLASNRNPPL